MSVLLVEDDQLVRSSIREMLTAEEFNVLEAGSGEQALEIWQQSATGIDLLVTDISMPGMSGIELVDRLGGQGGCLKALYISGFPELLDKLGAARRKAPFLRKPFSIEQVSRKIRAILNRPLHGWRCPRCVSRRYRGLTADREGDSLNLTFVCADCGMHRFSVVESCGVIERCPFCAGPVVPSGYSFVGEAGYHLGSMCHACRATIQTHTRAFAAIPWQ
jgi:DNA-binding response OmpR family regulator